MHRNIAVGRIEALDDHQRIVEAARRSLAERVIESLLTAINNVSDAGSVRARTSQAGSGRKSLARAYMRDAELLILDEPTAALDARAEQQIFSRFVELTEGKCGAHLPPLFHGPMADRILVLHEGSLLEDGSHDELLKREGIMPNCSASGFRLPMRMACRKELQA